MPPRLGGETGHAPMTCTTNARLAGSTFLIYIAAGITSLALASRAETADVRSLLSLVTSLSALVLGVTLYALTREQDRDLAMLALTCRIVEGMPGTADGAGVIFFAVASTIFSWLLLRGRMIPASLAGLGVVASVLLVAILSLQRAGLLGGATGWSSSITWMVWLPMLVFEVAFALWLLIRGVARPAPTDRRPDQFHAAEGQRIAAR
jgi:hypothetical protein